MANFLTFLWFNMQNLDADIIVIGAGIAGLAAAQKLRYSGHKVLVLEARDRSGGRIQTEEHQQEFYDLGASWIHGIENNPIWNIVQEHGIETIVFNYHEAAFYKHTGEMLDKTEQSLLDDALAYLFEKFEKLPSTHTYLNAEEALLEWLDSPKFHDQLKPVLLDFFKCIAEDPCACSLDQLSANFMQLEGSGSGDEVIFPKGYGQLIRVLSKNIRIDLNQVVKAIDYQKELIEITTQNRKYSCQKVIVTVPLGVLKSGNLEFTPKLPEAKQQAIESLGFGVFNKLFVTFEHAFWRDEQKKYVNSLYIHNEQQHAWLNFFDVSAIYHKPTLLFLFGGESAKWMEIVTDQAVWAHIQQTLALAFENIPKPLRMQKTEWGKDEFALGAFSFPKVGHSQTDVEALMMPIDNKVYFAGEHLSMMEAGTVHGAYASGVGVANNILNICCE